MLEKLRNFWKERSRSDSSTSSTKKNHPEEFFSPIPEEFSTPPETPKREKTVQEKAEEANRCPVFEDSHLDDLIKMRLKQIQQERGLQDEDIEVEKRRIRVVRKYQTLFEIPLPTKDPKLVEEAIKVMIGHIETKLNTKVDGLFTLEGEPKIAPSYEDLDKSLQEWYIETRTKKTLESSAEGSSESSTKKPRFNMFKASQKEEIHEVAYLIQAKGDALL